MKKEMPNTKEKWFEAIGGNVKVLAETVLLNEFFLITSGMLVEVDLTNRKYNICSKLGCQWFKMDKTEGYEPINESEEKENLLL